VWYDLFFIILHFKFLSYVWHDIFFIIPFIRVTWLIFHHSTFSNSSRANSFFPRDWLCGPPHYRLISQPDAVWLNCKISQKSAVHSFCMVNFISGGLFCFWKTALRPDALWSNCDISQKSDVQSFGILNFVSENFFFWETDFAARRPLIKLQNFMYTYVYIHVYI